MRFLSAPSSGLTCAIFAPSLIQGATKLGRMLGWSAGGKEHVGSMAGDNEAGAPRCMASCETTTPAWRRSWAARTWPNWAAVEEA